MYFWRRFRSTLIYEIRIEPKCSNASVASNGEVAQHEHTSNGTKNKFFFQKCNILEPINPMKSYIIFSIDNLNFSYL